jgi:tryptophan synthase alpha chain
MSLEQIKSTFARAKAASRPAFMPYWTLGYPNYDTSLHVIEAIAKAGADMFELGVPFSDPLADGPVIQHASQVALDNGMTMQKCLMLTATLRERGLQQPIFAMGYMNPVMAMGERLYAANWHKAGADGLIIPDLPPDESGVVAQACAERDMAMVQFVAPTSSDARMALSAKHATGFLYVVQVAGVTGAREKLAEGLQGYVERVKTQADRIPVVVGFGISKREHVQAVGQFADGVIVASALMRAAGEAADPPQAAYDFVRGLLA